jgi:hypothetical protein
MTREEAIKILQGAIKKPNTKDGYLGQALDMAIKALEQEPCEDAISRAYIEPIIEELENIYVNGDEHILNLLADIKNAPSVTPHITPTVLADALMEERIRGKLDSDTTFEKDIIDDVKCRLTVSIIDHRPCYCGAELREVWRESDGKDADSN